LFSGLVLAPAELLLPELPELRDMEEVEPDADVPAAAPDAEGVLADVGAEGEAPALLEAGLLLLAAELPLLPPAAPEEADPDLSTPP
jgi:hypothetical protein